MFAKLLQPLLLITLLSHLPPTSAAPAAPLTDISHANALESRDEGEVSVLADQSWRFTVHGILHINDDELFGGDETWDGTFNWYSVVHQSSSTTKAITQTMGGEIKVVIDLRIETHATWNNWPTLSYDFKFYEGLTEFTTDLDGQKTGSAAIATVVGASNTTLNLFEQAWNVDENVPDDFATLSLKVDGQMFSG